MKKNVNFVERCMSDVNQRIGICHGNNSNEFWCGFGAIVKSGNWFVGVEVSQKV